MKRVLITGKGSYIGTKVKNWLEKNQGQYQVRVIDMLDENWKDEDFSGFDSLLHVAGIAHRKDAPEELYEKVNHCLTLEVADKACKAGIKHFIFMSSGAVYSQNDQNHQVIMIDDQSPLAPVTPYGKSKKKAEEDLKRYAPDMEIAILRPPMVYGPGAKGNYNSLRRIALVSMVFPYIDNKRSMIYIDNLCEFIRLLIESEGQGVYLPQNKEYVNTALLIKEIRNCHKKKTYLLKGFSWVIRLLGKVMNPVNKAFGTFYYDRTEEYFEGRYQIVGFNESISITEKIGGEAV